MTVDFTEKAKRYQAIDEIIASGQRLKWSQIIYELYKKYNIKTSKTTFFRDIDNCFHLYNVTNSNQNTPLHILSVLVGKQ